jgi:hypothetical protein
MRQAAEERRQRIREFAAAHPEYDAWRLAEHFRLSITSIRVALRGAAS